MSSSMSTSPIEAGDPGEPARTRYDVFLSYNSNDRPMVRNVARRLRESRCPRVVRRGFVSHRGGDWQDELSARLLDSRACAVFVGPAISGWVDSR